ncbi:MAG: 6-phosphofructokinase, partial [Bdellovibrionales bacterium]|nr:6-phosphofructokinase [Bdellovibrionales bacterium]
MKIGIITSGGDAPGMNAAIRSVVRSAIANDIEVLGYTHGYQGVIDNDFTHLDSRAVGNIVQRGGTIIKTGRCMEFMKEAGRTKAANNLKTEGVEALVVVGGDGSMAGAQLLTKEHGIKCVGLPGTIDNDIWGSDLTIGFDTALNTALDAIDRIRDTATSHDRIFIVEVMGRDSGFLAIEVGVAGGAEQVFIPENPVKIDDAIDHIKKGMASGKKSHILIAAEGKKPGRGYDLAESIRKKTSWDPKVCVLGHVQRGGAPSARDRVLASRMGSAAIEALMHNQTG